MFHVGTRLWDYELTGVGLAVAQYYNIPSRGIRVAAPVIYDYILMLADNAGRTPASPEREDILNLCQMFLTAAGFQWR